MNNKRARPVEVSSEMDWEEDIALSKRRQIEPGNTVTISKSRRELSLEKKNAKHRAVMNRIKAEISTEGQTAINKRRMLTPKKRHNRHLLSSPLRASVSAESDRSPAALSNQDKKDVKTADGSETTSDYSDPSSLPSRASSSVSSIQPSAASTKQVPNTGVNSEVDSGYSGDSEYSTDSESPSSQDSGKRRATARVIRLMRSNFNTTIGNESSGSSDTFNKLAQSMGNLAVEG